MYLKELSINGFKSFAKKSELEFSAPITAIVGPNGSGKSNVAESFRFVLGEQSVKAMRGKKGEDLIWGGSEKVGRGNRANVEIVFDNSKRTFSLYFDEVKIERVVHRDGQNEYKLNGSTVRLKDVHELLANANIGATGHHIISQGEADRVLAAGAKERREMIEDALGLKVFQLKKSESERKLNKTLENIAQVESLRREAAPHLRYLKKQVERAERSLEVQAQLKQAYTEYLKREDVYIACAQDRLQSERIKPEQDLKDVQEKLEKVQHLLAKKDDSKIDTEIQEAETDFKKANQNRQQAEKVVSGIAGQVTFLERRLTQASAVRVETETVISSSKLEAVVLDIEEKLQTVTTDANVLKNLLQTVVQSLRSLLHKEVVTPIDTTSVDKAELEKLTEELQKAKQEVEKMLKIEVEKETILSISRTKKDSDTVQNHEAERDMFTLREQQRELDLQLRQIDTDLQIVHRDREEFKRELQEAVTLIGRNAADYFSFVIKQDEVEVTTEQIASEPRDQQVTRRRELEKLKIRLEELGIGDSQELLKEYKTAQERDEFLAKELADLDESVSNLKELITDLQSKLEEQFITGIDKISVEFNRFFTLMFGGGSASLSRVQIPAKQQDENDDDEQEMHDGVELQVSLPNKRVKGLTMLSGGERALVSIAVIFAMSQVNPPPFIILDETDAALDEANSRRYGDMIEELAKKSQLVLITHNRETMSRAGILYGITMGLDGASKVLSVKFDEAAAVAK